VIQNLTKTEVHAYVNIDKSEVKVITVQYELFVSGQKFSLCFTIKTG